MKYLIFFLSLLISNFFFAQITRDTLSYRERYALEKYEPTKSEEKRCENQKKKDKKTFEKLTAESININFEKLTDKIIEDLDSSEFKGEVLLFYYRFSGTVCGNFEDNDYVCEKEYNTTNPYYGRSNWSYKHLFQLSENLKEKIIIPSKKNSGFSISNNLFFVKNNDNQEFSKFKIGTIYDLEVNDGNEKFYYLSEKKSNETLTLKSNYIYNEILNKTYDTLYFEFENWLGYKVKVTQILNGKSTTKIYEYHNKEWQFIESN